MDLNLLPILERLIATQSVTTTALELDMSVPSVSRALAKLRVEYGDELLVRSGRTMCLTPRAESIYPGLNSILGGIHELKHPQHEIDICAVERRFNIRCDDVFAGVIAHQLTDRLAKSAPGLQIELVSETTSSDMDIREGAIDLEVGGRSGFPQETVVRKVGELPLVALMGREHPLSKKRLTIKRLFEYPHVLTRNQKNHERALLSALSAAGIQRQTSIVVASYYVAGVVVRQSDMVATMPRIMARHLSDTFGLTYASVPLPLPPIRASVAWHSRFRADPVHQWLRNELIELVTNALTAPVR